MAESCPYAYAKACGIIGKSFIGKRMSSLHGLHTLNDLDRLIFPNNYSNLPLRELLPDLESRITMRAVSRILSILESYSNPPKLIEQMIRAYEYNDLKTVIHAIVAGKKEPPNICNIGRFRTINFKAFPDIKKMLENTEFDFLLKDELRTISRNMDTVSVEKKIDELFYQNLIKSLDQLSDEDHWVMQHFLVDEISLHNCAWTLRLRSYYQKKEEEIKKFLMDFKVHGKKKGSLAAEAIQSFEYPLDSRYQWDNWKWEELLNPEEPAVHWKLDPRYFQNAASNYLLRLAYKFFRRNPMAASAIFCFIKLIQIEEDILTSIAEGLALGMDSNAVFSLLEVKS
ncbi:MAG: V-type ATPase subunit [Treponema sp.]|jgi:vacuolar-type H+-ATPase subunit C/Vma6|nr:V-type ATPase subunit [Treponema sp.]